MKWKSLQNKQFRSGLQPGWTDHIFSAPVPSSATPCVRCHARLNLAVTTLEFFRPMVEQIFAREPWAVTH